MTTRPDRPLVLPAHVAQARFADAGAMAEALADRIAALLREALDRRPEASLVVSGGRSPVPFFGALGARPLAWSRVVVTLADERWVPPEHADSNEGLVRRHLLQGPVAAARFVPLFGGEPAAADGLAACAARLAQVPRPFDVVVLGVGQDGHFASLFPGAPGLPALLRDSAPPLGAVVPPHAAQARITLSLPALLDARQLLLPLQGEAKRRVIERAAAASVETLPVAALLQQFRAPLQVFFCPAG